jgi:hypothetical protein
VNVGSSLDEARDGDDTGTTTVVVDGKYDLSNAKKMM